MTQAVLAHEIETAAQKKQIDIVLRLLPHLSRFQRMSGQLARSGWQDWNNCIADSDTGLDIAKDILLNQNPKCFLPYLFTAIKYRRFTVWNNSKRTEQFLIGYRIELENKHIATIEAEKARRTLITISVCLARLNRERKLVGRLTRAQTLAQIGIDYVLAGYEWQEAIALAMERLRLAKRARTTRIYWANKALKELQLVGGK